MREGNLCFESCEYSEARELKGVTGKRSPGESTVQYKDQSTFGASNYRAATFSPHQSKVTNIGWEVWEVLCPYVHFLYHKSRIVTVQCGFINLISTIWGTTIFPDRP